MMKKQENFNDLIASIQEAFIQANKIAETQHLDMLSHYFDQDKKPICFQMAYPEYDENGKVVYRTLSVPKLCVVPLSSLKLKEISVDFKVKLYGKISLKKSEPQQQTNALKGTSSGQRPPQETGYLGYIPGLGRRDSSDNYAQISLKFESEDPPEGLMRISDQLTKVTL